MNTREYDVALFAPLTIDGSNTVRNFVNTQLDASSAEVVKTTSKIEHEDLACELTLQRVREVTPTVREPEHTFMLDITSTTASSQKLHTSYPYESGVPQLILNGVEGDNALASKVGITAITFAMNLLIARSMLGKGEHEVDPRKLGGLTMSMQTLLQLEPESVQQMVSNSEGSDVDADTFPMSSKEYGDIEGRMLSAGGVVSSLTTVHRNHKPLQTKRGLLLPRTERFQVLDDDSPRSCSKHELELRLRNPPPDDENIATKVLTIPEDDAVPPSVSLHLLSGEVKTRPAIQLDAGDFTTIKP